MSAPQTYQYVVLRCVPRAEREEFVNVGVVLEDLAEAARVKKYARQSRLAQRGGLCVGVCATDVGVLELRV